MFIRVKGQILGRRGGFDPVSPNHWCRSRRRQREMQNNGGGLTRRSLISSLADGTDLIPLISISGGCPGEGPVAGRRIPKR